MRPRTTIGPIRRGLTVVLVSVIDIAVCGYAIMTITDAVVNSSSTRGSERIRSGWVGSAPLLGHISLSTGHSIPGQVAYACASTFHYHDPSLETHNNAACALDLPCHHRGDQSE